ncbi:hypothetical protein CR205_09335 [Alteribacter lacisalsi]|uniref:Uncharacterized protein n=1 Tax=Alteribacter lacisalsi TaxID=2045244 RepID=A0A2W0HC46_9BACI|nr:hypothetical protein [Alteribacter lacisalsi]PYZ98757.1 hypothetical protein CR205_09335 [Alteribacter lacisalsi]
MPLPDPERKQRQIDILWRSLSDNELLPEQLDTNASSVIPAINELFASIQENIVIRNDFIEGFNHHVGNMEQDSEDWNNIMEIDRNLIRAVYKIHLSQMMLENTLQSMAARISALEDGTAAPKIIDGGSFTTEEFCRVLDGGSFVTEQDCIADGGEF